jgi:hypothetical protein
MENSKIKIEKLSKFKKQGSAVLLRRLELALDTAEDQDLIKEVLALRKVSFEKAEEKPVKYSEEILSRAKENIGKDCHFIPRLKGITLSGKIQSIITDKRNGNKYFRIVRGEKKMNLQRFHVLITNKEIIIEI